jgi:purine-cytosine permease-like protein
MPFYISPPPRNPVTGVIAGIFGILVMAGAFMLGFVALIIALGVGLVIWTGIYLRIWFVRRRMARDGVDPADLNPFKPNPDPGRQDSLDAEYTVVSTEKDD